MSELLECVVAFRNSQATTLVAIDGHGAAGKSTLAAALASALKTLGQRVSIIRGDDFYRPSSVRPRGAGAEKGIDDDFDWERLRDQVVDPLRHGRAASYSRYDWVEDALAETHVLAPRGIVVVEGISSLRRELAALYDVRVWVDCPRDLRLARAIARDGEACRSLWVDNWMPREDLYVNEHRPDRAADLVLSGLGDGPPGATGGPATPGRAWKHR